MRKEQTIKKRVGPNNLPLKGHSDTNLINVESSIKNFIKVKDKERIFRKTINPSFNTLPGCIAYYGHPMKPNGPCETCKCNFICEKCTPKGLMEIIFKEKVKCKPN